MRVNETYPSIPHCATDSKSACRDHRFHPMVTGVENMGKGRWFTMEGQQKTGTNMAKIGNTYKTWIKHE